MNNIQTFKTIPIGALVSRPEEEDSKYTKKIPDLPPNIKTLISSERTGAYVRGLVKHHDLPEEKAPQIAFSVLQVALGEKQLAQLSSLLSSNVQISSDLSQKIADEIEKDLFAPVMLELNNYLAQKKKDSKSTSPTEGMDNVVNLKDNPTPKKSFPLPPKK